VNRSAAEAPDAPLGAVTVISTVPVPAGEIAVIKVAEPTVKLAALAAPNFTADAPVNPVPAIATDVPPAAGPDVGAIDVTAAAAADEPFIKHLFKTSRAGDFAAAGLPDSVPDILLHQQSTRRPRVMPHNSRMQCH
jgi:hypothetical protein